MWSIDFYFALWYFNPFGIKIDRQKMTNSCAPNIDWHNWTLWGRPLSLSLICIICVHLIKSTFINMDFTYHTKWNLNQFSCYLNGMNRDFLFQISMILYECVLVPNTHAKTHHRKAYRAYQFTIAGYMNGIVCYNFSFLFFPFFIFI